MLWEEEIICDRLYHNEEYKVGKINFEIMVSSGRQFKELSTDTKIISIPVLFAKLST